MIGLGLDENVSQGMGKIEESIEGVSAKSKDLEMIGKRIDDLSKKSLPARRELKQLQDIMANMNLKGLTNTDEFTKAAVRAGELKDAMSDAQQAVSSYANDVQNLKAAGDMFTGVAAAGSVATGVMGMFGVENEKVQQILLKVQAAQAILNGVTAISNVLNKDSALMLKIKQIRMLASMNTTKADTVATTANTVATNVNTIGTKASTVAQTAWNTAKAIGKAMLGDFTGLLLLGIGAVATYAAVTASSTDKVEDNTSALGENKKALEVVKDAESTYASTTASNFATLMKSYDDLRDAWNKLKSAKEKNQFLKDNKTKIEELTTAIRDIDSAEKVFNDKTGNVVKAFKLRAQAAAAAAVQIEMYKKAMEAEMNMKFGLRGAEVGKDTFNKLPKNVQDQLKVTKTERKVVGSHYTPGPDGGYTSREYADVPVRWVIPDNASQELLQAIRKAGFTSANAQQEYLRAMELANEADTKSEELLAQANALLAEGKKGGSGSGSNKGNTNTKKQIETIGEAIEAYKKFDAEIKKVQQNIEQGWITPEAGQNTIKTFKEAQKKILNDWSSKGMKVPVEIELPSNSIKAIEDQIKELQEKRVKVNVDSSEFRELTSQIKELEHKKINIEATINKDEIDREIKDIVTSIKPSNDTKYDFSYLPDDIAQQADEVVAQLDRVKDARQRLNDIINNPKSSDYEIAEATSALAGMEEEYKRLTQEASKFNEVAAQIKERQKEFENFTNSVQTISNVVGSIDAVKSSFESFQNAVNEGKDGWEIMMAAFQTGMAIMSAVTTVMEIVNALQDAQNIKKALGATTIAKEAATHTANSTAEAAEAATTTALAVAEGAAVAPTLALALAVKKLAGAQIFQAHASIPFVGPPAAAAGVAMMEATLAAITAFANGGIVEGSSTMGDHMIARVNAGEMILNDRQQANLFKMINEGQEASKSNVQVSVSGKVRGKDLELVLANLNGVKKLTTGGLKF